MARYTADQGITERKVIDEGPHFLLQPIAFKLSSLTYWLSIDENPRSKTVLAS